MSELIKYINELPGYKISNTHFRIGSKIHISHFYYAKRLFQNSFFASRLAFLITKEILTTHANRIETFKKDGISLIGYGLYSELLLSLVEIFLKKALTSKKIDHNLISDADEPSYIKSFKGLNNNIIIIVPIGSTFSTAIKIKEFISKTENLNDKEILEPYINVLYVSHSPTNLKEKRDENNIYLIEKNFGWTRKDNKTISIKELSATTEKKQKYLLELQSEWHDVSECIHCFPQNLDFNKERPLYFTDKSSVTPTLIFGEPISRKIEDVKHKINLSNKTLQFGHLIRGINHFHYYIKIEDFFQENLNKIEEWLNALIQNFKESFDETSRVIIISPGHYSNTAFINLVNERLFSNAANIIHYETQNDHILNFNLLYGNELNEKDTKLVFVDDSINTGSTFRKINFFVENAKNNNDKKAKTFDACIFLLDRSDQNVHKQFEAKTESYFSFANLHLPSLNDFDGECPLDIWYNRYHELVYNSFLTRMQIHFLSQKDKLQEKVIDCTLENINSGHHDKESYVRQVEAIHRIYELCRKFGNLFDTTFDNWKWYLLNKTTSPFQDIKLNKNSSDKNSLSDETTTLLKMLTHSPFIHYKPVKDNVFKWVLLLLELQINHLKSEIRKDGLEYISFKDLKFLIRRAGQLNTNFLISKTIFEFLKQLYSDKGLSRLSADKKEKILNVERLMLEDSNTEQNSFFKKSKETLEAELDKLNLELENTQDFHVFYTAQIKELLYLNEARSIKLEKTINELNGDIDLPYSYKQLLRFIQEENGILILNFWHFIKNNLGDISYNKLLENNIIIKILKNDTIKEHFRSKILNEFLSITDSGKYNLHDNIPLVAFIKLMCFFEIEQSEFKLFLNNKTDFILEQMKKIIFSNTDEHKDKQSDIKSGAFFLVKYKRNENPFLAYNKGNYGGLDETSLKQDIFLNEFLNSSNNRKLYKTIIELHKENGLWTDLYAKEESDKILDNDFKFIPDEYNRLLIIRFNKLKVKQENNKSYKFIDRLTDEGQAIAGFYFNNKSNKITDISKTRYLMLLRSSISSFIERHHETNEFRDWVEADNRKRTELLTGHGREMLIEVAANHMHYRNIINTILLIQMLILNLEEERAFDLRNENNGTGKAVINVFKNLYKTEVGANVVDLKYFSKLNNMAKEIFSYEEIENKVEELDIPDNIPNIKECFEFPFDILDMIVFELFVNAKKNRWLFINNETFTDGCKTYSKNEVEIKAESDNNSLKLVISNTGPGENSQMKEIIKKLNNGVSPKGYKSVAGLSLIRKLIDEFDLGSLEFKSLQISDNFCKFIVELTLKNWKKDAKNITN